MIGLLELDKEGKITSPVSAYSPTEAVSKLTSKIKQDYQTGYNLQHKPFTEFNDVSLLDRADIDQKRWNCYREPKSNDPDESWRWTGIRPITRNKIIAIVAQLTSRIQMPAPHAQNDQDEEDRASAQVMRDLMEYDVRNSSYVDNYIQWINTALVDPIAYMGVGFAEVMQTVKSENEGKISKKDVIDGVLSGFQTYNIPLDEILIGNYYQKNLDRQRFVIRRRYIEYDELKALYGDHENFEFVRPGIKSVFSGTDNSLFYDIYDATLQTLGEEIIYFNRLEDTEIPYVNGVYLGDKDTEDNRIKHRDNEDKPKYNFSGLGYEHISPRFFFYKSAAWKLGDDDELVQRMLQLTVDATFLSVMPPIFGSGMANVSEAVVIPGKMTTSASPDAKIQPIQLGSAIQAGWGALDQVQHSMAESTQDAQRQGIAAGSQKTALEASILEQNAKVAMGLFGNMLGNSLKRLGGLMIDVILQHQTVADIDETTGKENWRSFILSDVPEKGKSVTKKITFEPGMFESDQMPESDLMARSMDMMNEEGGVDSDMRIYKVNPEKWRKLKYSMVVDVDELLPKNDNVERILKQNVADRLLMNPVATQFVDAEAVVRDFYVEPMTRNSDKYMNKSPVMPMGMPPVSGIPPAQLPNPSLNI